MSVNKAAGTMKLFTMEELQEMAMHAVLKGSGIGDVEEFLKSNNVKYQAAFRAGMGVSVMILNVSEIPSTPSEPTI